MVYGDGCILRTYGVPGKGLVYVIMEYVISLVEMVRPCCHVYVAEAMVGTLALILV